MAEHGFKKAMISFGRVRLNKISRYLKDIQDNVTPELLVSPVPVFGKWIDNIQRIRNINGDQGLYFNNQTLKGMLVFDQCEEGHYNSIEKEIALVLRAAWGQANQSGQDVITGVFMGSIQIVRGHEKDGPAVTVTNNLYAYRNKITEQLSSQWSCTEGSEHSRVLGVSCEGKIGWGFKDQGQRHSYPVALRFSAPGC